MRDLGLSGTARASFYIYNDRDDVDALMHALRQAATVFAGVKS
jgi:cysteine desulfurase/selenocysteine lyase